MSCSICAAKKSSGQITQTEDGASLMIQVCKKYAAEMGINDPAGFSLAACSVAQCSKGARVTGSNTPEMKALVNVTEWCWDWTGNYSSAAQTGPHGPASSADSFRVIRGGSWHNPPVDSRVATRSDSCYPSFRKEYLGFRSVLH